MKCSHVNFSNLLLPFILLISFSSDIFSQYSNPSKPKSDFWSHVQFGGSFVANFSNNYTELTLAPGALYNFNQFFALGTGIQGTYISSKNNFDSSIYGVNLIGLVNPFPQLQFSAEIEELYVQRTETISPGISIKDDFWNTALFLGAGYRSQNITVGMRYNVLFNENKQVYADAFMPFVRAYF
ncbi:MAG: hypothetical protein ACI7YS_04270 [Flavobacterium sp.]